MLFCSPPLGIPIILDRLLAVTVGYDSSSVFLFPCLVSTHRATRTSALIFFIGASGAYAKGRHYCAELLLQNDLQNDFNLSVQHFCWIEHAVASSLHCLAPRCSPAVL